MFIDEKLKFHCHSTSSSYNYNLSIIFILVSFVSSKAKMPKARSLKVSFKIDHREICILLEDNKPLGDGLLKARIPKAKLGDYNSPEWPRVKPLKIRLMRTKSFRITQLSQIIKRGRIIKRLNPVSFWENGPQRVCKLWQHVRLLFPILIHPFSLSLSPPPMCSNSKRRKILYCGVTRENRAHFYTRRKYISANEPRPRYYTGNTPVTIPRCVSLFRGEPSAQTGRKEFRVLSLEMVSRMIHTHI